MNYLILFIGLTIGLICSAQEPVAAAESYELKVLYRGYINKVYPNLPITDNGKINVWVSNASIKDHKDDKNEDFYSVVPGQGKIVTLKFSIGTGDSTEVIKTLKYRVSNLPDTELYWGDVKNGGIGNIQATELFVRHSPLFELDSSHKIVSWEISCRKDTIAGVGSNISSAEEFLRKIPSQSILMMVIIVEGSDGIRRVRNAHWKVPSWKEETDFNPLGF